MKEKFSGGGLISGVALAAKSINPAIRILAAEPKGADDAARSKAAGEIVKLPETNTIADGLRAFLGELTWYLLHFSMFATFLFSMEIKVNAWS